MFPPMAAPKPPAQRPNSRRRTRAMLPESLVGNPLEGTAPARPRLTYSPYPDLSMAIEMLEKRQKHITGERQAIITRWLDTLTKMQAEMQKLHKLEIFASRLTSSEK